LITRNTISCSITVVIIINIKHQRDKIININTISGSTAFVIIMAIIIVTIIVINNNDSIIMTTTTIISNNIIISTSSATNTIAIVELSAMLPLLEPSLMTGASQITLPSRDDQTVGRGP
jgi:hypothetical protein